MTPARFDELIHSPTRLAIVSLLDAVEWADFKVIRDQVGLSDSALSKQLSTLEEAGYVQIRKTFIGKRPHSSSMSPRCSRSCSRPASPCSRADLDAGTSPVGQKGCQLS